MSHFKRKQLLKLIGPFLTLLVLMSSSAAPVKADTIGVSLDSTVRLNGVTILDQSPFDLNTTVGIVGFSQTIRGFEISGDVLAQVPIPTVRMVDTTIRCTDALGCGVLPLVFFRTFLLTLGAFHSGATDEIWGTFSNPNGLSADASVDFQGFINGAGVGPVFTFTAPARSTSAGFGGKTGTVRRVENGDVLLDGVMNVTLPGQGDTLSLQYAFVAVPEPATFLLAGLGTVVVVVARRILS